MSSISPLNALPEASSISISRRVEDGIFLDGAVSFTFGTPQTAIAGLSMHEGATVWAMADAYVEGPYVVSGGAITLANASTNVTVGRWTAPVAQTLPLVRDVGPHTVLKRPARVHSLMLDVIGTTSVAVGANGLPAKDVALYKAGGPTDAPLAPVTDLLQITGLKGFDYAGMVTITQTRPGALTVRDIVVSARI